MLSIKTKILFYFSGIIVYGLAIVIYTINPYYQNFLSKTVDLSFLSGDIQTFFRLFFSIVGWSAWESLFNLFIVYVVLSLIIGILGGWSLLQRPYIFLKAIISICKQIPQYLKKLGKDIDMIEISHEEKITMLFFLVKFFWLPIMLTFTFGNFGLLSQYIDNIFEQGLSLEQWTKCLYFILFNAIFFVDTLWYVFGYIFEADFLGNKVKSVDVSLFGWAVALFCYPPFNQITGQFLPWGSSDYADFGNFWVTTIILILVLVCMFFYLWATLSLGTRCSNLTNRGIVSGGAFSIVRHPSYSAKNISWFLLALPLIGFHGELKSLSFPFIDFSIQIPLIDANWIVLLSLIGCMIIYFLRAVTEERHLMQDSQYREYCEKVKYRFVPGFF